MSLIQLIRSWLVCMSVIQLIEFLLVLHEHSSIREDSLVWANTKDAEADAGWHEES